MLNRLRQLLGKQIGQSPSAKTPPISGGSKNPAKGFRFRLSVEGPAGKRDENIDLVQILAEVFKELNREYSAHDSQITDIQSATTFRPGIVTFQPNDDLSMQTCTTVEFFHPKAFPQHCFEYQHSAGPTGALSVMKGFQDWARVDLPVILDAQNPNLKTCTAMEFTLPNNNSRRVVLGPVSRTIPMQGEPAVADTESHSPLCPCCLFSNSVNALKPLVDSKEVAGIRMYAARSPDGTAHADCRVNGDDFPAGTSALIDYVRTWPGRDFEVRKQYIVIQDKPHNSER